MPSEIACDFRRYASGEKTLNFPRLINRSCVSLGSNLGDGGGDNIIFLIIVL